MSQPNAESTVDRPSDYSAWIGRTIDDRYRIDELLGEGGMGAVFLAEHLKLRKKVAFKVILPELAGSGELAKRFAREATASARLEHPHVASAIDYGTLPEGGAYLVMQYVRGESVRDVLDTDGKLGWARACEIGAQIAGALHAAHQAGIVHRDLKPDNVMIEPRSDGALRVKVLDFGVAHVVETAAPERAGTQLTRVGTVIGTPGYMAPEQALGEAIDFRTDLYALGLVILEMITGNAVYEGMELTAIVTRQLTEDVPRLRDLSNEQVPDELDILIGRLLAKNREERPDSASAVRDTLRALLLGDTLRAVTDNPSLHDLSASELARIVAAGRDPTPLAVQLAPRATAARTEPSSDAASSGKTITLPTPVARAVVRARTVLTHVGERLDESRVPRRAVALGCAAAALGAIALSCGLAWAFDDAPNETVVQTIDKTRAARRRPRPAAAPAPARAPTAPSTPRSIAALEAQLLTGDSSREREAAARQILAHVPGEDVHAVVRALAELETARGCRAKRELVVRLGAAGDPRALPALQRLDTEPRNRCGNLFRRRDCLGCLREQLRETLAALERG